MWKEKLFSNSFNPPIRLNLKEILFKFNLIVGLKEWERIERKGFYFSHEIRFGAKLKESFVCFNIFFLLMQHYFFLCVGSFMPQGPLGSLDVSITQGPLGSFNASRSTGKFQCLKGHCEDSMPQGPLRSFKASRATGKFQSLMGHWKVSKSKRANGKFQCLKGHCAVMIRFLKWTISMIHEDIWRS